MLKWFAGMAVAVSLVVTASAQDATAIIKKAIEAQGGADALTKMKASSATIKGSLSIAGQEMEFTGRTVSENPGKYRVEIDADIMGQKLSVLQIGNGDKAKSKVTLAGMALPGGTDDEKDEIKMATAMQDAMTLVPLLNNKDYELKLGESAMVNDKKANVVNLTFVKLKKDVSLFFDAESNLLVKTQRKSKGPGADGQLAEVDEETFAGGYEKIQGLMQPTKIEVKHDGKKFMKYTVSDIKLSEKANAKEFAIDD